MKKTRWYLIAVLSVFLLHLVLSVPAFATEPEVFVPVTSELEETFTEEMEETKSEYSLLVTVENTELGYVEVQYGEKISESGITQFIPPSTKVTITAKPIMGYALKEWVSTDAGFELPDDKVSAESITFSMPKKEINLIAVFEPVKMYTLVVEPDDISGTSYVVSEKIAYRAGEIVKVDAMPFEGFAFTEWGETCTTFEFTEEQKTNSKLEFVMPAEDVVLTMKFTPITYYFTVMIQGFGEVEIFDKEEGENKKYECTVGEEIAISAIPGEGNFFTRWDGINGAEFEEYDQTETTLICPASDFSIVANFASSAMELTIKAGEGGSVSPEGTMRFGVDNIFNLTAIPNPGFVFAGWECSSEKGKFADVKSAATEFTMPNEDCTVTATFRKGGYKLSAKTSAGGTVEGETGVYEMGKEVALKAVPMKGYAFSHWETNVNDTISFPSEAEVIVTVPGRDVEVTAIFVLKTAVVPVSRAPFEPEESGFPWIGIIAVFFVSLVVIVLIVLREKFNLSYRYLIRKWLRF